MRGQVSPSVRCRKQTKGKKSKHDIRAAVWVVIVQSIPTKIVQGAAAGDTCAAAEEAAKPRVALGPAACIVSNLYYISCIMETGQAGKPWKTRLYLHSLAHPLQGTHTIRTRTCSMYLN